METVCLYPGTFSPPTYGHQQIAIKAAALFPHLIIVCSVNPNKKDPWFTPEEAKKLWQGYTLPSNVEVMTLEEFLTKKNSGQIIMVRGVRDEKDAAEEKEIMIYNHQRFGINGFFYLFCEPEYRDISSTSVRQAAEAVDLQQLAKCVSPLIVSTLLEKTIGLNNLFLVVGRPGSGKSTLLRKLAEIETGIIHIDTDRFLDELKPKIAEHFSGRDLCQMAIEQEDDLKKLIAATWMKRLQETISALPRGNNVFLEIAYAMQPDKTLYRFVGGKIIYVDCGQPEENRRRIIIRGTPQHLGFVERIPNWKTTLEIAKQNNLSATRIDNTDFEQGMIQLQQLIAR